jgi:hypothetical protein
MIAGRVVDPRGDLGRILAGGLIASYAAAIAVAHGVTALLLAIPLIAFPAAIWLLRSPNAWLTLFFAVALLAPPLPVAALGNSGPHPAIAIAAVGVAMGLIRLPQWRFERALLPGALIVFFAILIVSIAPAALYSGTDLAFESLARVGLAAISAFVFFYVSSGPGRIGSISLQLIYWIAVASAAFAILDFYYQFPRPPASGRSSSGWKPACTGARRDCFTKPARWGISARSFW